MANKFRIFKLYFMDGLKQSEIASMLGITQGQVSRHITRLRNEYEIGRISMRKKKIIKYDDGRLYKDSAQV